MARDVKGSRDVHSIWTVEERLGKWKVLLNGAKGLGTKDTEKAEIVVFLPLSFLVRFTFRKCSVSMLCHGDSKSIWSRGCLPSVEEKQIKKLPTHAD